MIRRGAAIGFAIALALSGGAIPASAGSPIEVKIKCPVGGKRFTHIETAALTTWGERPDGKPYGSWTFPMPIPECPDNSLVMYRDFEKHEIPALTALVQSSDYRALRAETTYYRAAWLAERMDRDKPRAPIWLLLRATWQVDETPALKARYQREFAARAAAVAVDATDVDSLILHYRLANAYRELGDFTAALGVLDAFPFAALDVTMPEGEDATGQAEDDAGARLYLREQIPALRQTIATGDSSAEPIALLPENVAAWLCFEQIQAGTNEPAARCNDPAIREEIANIREMREGEPAGASVEVD